MSFKLKPSTVKGLSCHLCDKKIESENHKLVLSLLKRHLRLQHKVNMDLRNIEVKDKTEILKKCQSAVKAGHFGHVEV